MPIDRGSPHRQAIVADDNLRIRSLEKTVRLKTPHRNKQGTAGGGVVAELAKRVVSPATALGHVAYQHGYRVKFIRADDMLRFLRQGRFDNSRNDLMISFMVVDLLILDDFVIEVMTRRESRDICQLFLERTGTASTIITSKRDTSEWLAMFDDMLLAQSAVDRFKNSAYDLVIDGESYRPKLKPKLDSDETPLPAVTPKRKAVGPPARRQR